MKYQKTDWNGPEAHYDLRTGGQTSPDHRTSGSRFYVSWSRSLLNFLSCCLGLPMVWNSHGLLNKFDILLIDRWHKENLVEIKSCVNVEKANVTWNLTNFENRCWNNFRYCTSLFLWYCDWFFYVKCFYLSPHRDPFKTQDERDHGRETWKMYTVP